MPVRSGHASEPQFPHLYNRVGLSPLQGCCEDAVMCEKPLAWRLAPMGQPSFYLELLVVEYLRGRRVVEPSARDDRQWHFIRSSWVHWHIVWTIDSPPAWEMENNNDLNKMEPRFPLVHSPGGSIPGLEMQVHRIASGFFDFLVPQTDRQV